MTNTLAYQILEKITAVKSLIVQALGVRERKNNKYWQKFLGFKKRHRTKDTAIPRAQVSNWEFV